MSISLHEAVIKTYLQILPNVGNLVAAAEEHCAANGLNASALTGACLTDDMWPFAKQIFECGHHSARAVIGVREGKFGPEIGEVPQDFASLRKEVEDALAIVSAVQPDELEALAGGDVLFAFGDYKMNFTVPDFLLSFSLPNFYFHAATAYGILRARGLSVGKRDFLGQVRVKP